MSRVVPVIQGLSNRGVTISIDTRHAETMSSALKAGATFINDVHALQGEGCIQIAAQSRGANMPDAYAGRSANDAGCAGIW